MRIMIADPDSASRSALSLLIDAQTDLELVGDVASITDLLVGIRSTQPDVVVLDWDTLSHRIDALRELLELFEHPPRIIALGVQQEASQHAMSSGATSFAFKGNPPEQLLALIRQAATKRVDDSPLESTQQQPD